MTILKVKVNVRQKIQIIVTNVTSMFTRTCLLFLIAVTSSKYVGNYGQRETLHKARFPQMYRFQQAKPIRKLTIQIPGLLGLENLRKTCTQVSCKVVSVLLLQKLPTSRYM